MPGQWKRQQLQAFIPSQKYRKASRNCQNQCCHNYWKQSKVYIMKQMMNQGKGNL